MADVHFQLGCQFGQHGEPFLWAGSSLDEVDIAIKNLINLSKEDSALALEACEFIDACVEDAKRFRRNNGTQKEDNGS